VEIDHINESYIMVEQNWPSEDFHNFDRSDRCVILIRSLRSTNFANFGRQHMPSIFFEKSSVPKNIVLEQICLRAMRIEFIGHILLSVII
jgi:hypothetical protein